MFSLRPPLYHSGSSAIFFCISGSDVTFLSGTRLKERAVGTSHPANLAMTYSALVT